MQAVKPQKHIDSTQRSSHFTTLKRYGCAGIQKIKLPILLVLFSLFLCSGCSRSKQYAGLIDEALRPCPSSPNCVCSQESNSEHAITPLSYPNTAVAAKQQLLTIVMAEPRTRLEQDKANYFHVTYRSAIFRFIDDVEFYFIENSPRNTTIHARSASRSGYWDFGVNRKRIERLRNTLNSASQAEEGDLQNTTQ